ncbi:MAG TPA: YicC/YloC family endoribonuclease [Gammaproteobacteria bacterium]|nr:YicC/YloC family endoribonuclease [Gammaproteobacteria bacterium]
MIFSMTAFARLNKQDDWGRATWELRSVNHRYLEIMLKLPEPFRSWEVTFRESIQEALGRGKVDGILVFTPSYALQPQLDINVPLVEELGKACKAIANIIGENSGSRLTDILRWPEVLEAKELDLSPLKKPILALLEASLKELIACREREGAGLKAGLEDKLSLMRQQVGVLRDFAPQTGPLLREKILARLEAVKESCDQARLEQELVFMVGRSDVEEELERLETHIQEMARVLKVGGQVGRRCDFLMQEINREANTLSAKAVIPKMTQSAIEIKVLVEQMREQIQNVE